VPLGFPTPTPLGTLILSQFINVPKAVSDGIEITAVWNPIDHLNLTLTYGLDHTEITAGCNAFSGLATKAAAGCYIDPLDPLGQAAGAQVRGYATSTTSVPVPGTSGVGQQYVTSNDVYQSVKGAELPQAPENKIAFNANYTFEFEPGKLILSGSYIWKDKSFASVFERSYNEAPSWSQVDLRATWSGDHDKYEVVFYVKNLLNTVGYDAAAGGGLDLSPQGGGGMTQVSSYDLTPPRLYGMELHYKF
jgi:iron complex outermembrane receptor protein